MKIIAIQPGAPPTCTVKVNGKIRYGVRLVMGPNGWQPYITDVF